MKLNQKLISHYFLAQEASTLHPFVSIFSSSVSMLEPFKAQSNTTFGNGKL